MGKRRVILFTIAFLFAAFHGGARADGTAYRKMCEEHAYAAQYSECVTNVEEAGGYITATCGFYKPKDYQGIMGSYGFKGVPPMNYVCYYENRGDAKVLACEGGQSLSMTSRSGYGGPNGVPITKTLTEKEFLDTQTRCSSLCCKCSQGWK